MKVFFAFLFSMIGLSLFACNQAGDRKCEVQLVKVQEYCDNDDGWTGVNITFHLANDSLGGKKEKINKLLLNAYNKAFTTISDYKLQELDKLTRYVKNNGCMEGFHFHSKVVKNEEGILGVHFESFYVDTPTSQNSEMEQGGSIEIDLSQGEVI